MVELMEWELRSEPSCVVHRQRALASVTLILHCCLVDLVVRQDRRRGRRALDKEETLL